jgi:hypothetical protein
MPLVPIEQILSRGIGSIASIFTKVLVNALVGSLIVVIYWSERHERKVVHPSEWSKLFYIGMPASVLVLAIILPWEGAAVVAVGAVTMLAMLAIAGVAEVSGAKGLVFVASASAVAILPMSIAASLIEPPPLPEISIIRSQAGPVSGELVANNGNNWYISGSHHGIRVIPDNEVQRSVIVYPKRDKDPSLLELIF